MVAVSVTDLQLAESFGMVNHCGQPAVTTMAPHSPSHTEEDYLKAIFVLEEGEGRAATSALAAHLNITPGSVTSMLRRMSSATPRLITYRPHQGARLTARGRQSALDVIRRHRLLETFLHKVLDLGWDEVHAEAEVLEHHISVRVADAMAALLGNPQFDPHGEPIPDRDGALPQASRLGLTDAPLNTVLRIVQVHPSHSDLLPYLDSLGISVGTRVVLLNRAPLEGPLSLELIDNPESPRCAIGRKAAGRIRVKLE
jgi:DtxR family Mn-dependent transcriptional regulator